MLACAGVLVGCGGPKNFDNDNDALRRERESLTVENDRLRAQVGELRAKLDEIARTNRLADGEDAEALARATPRCGGIDLHRFTALIDQDAEPGAEAIEVVLSPFDGRKRFIQVSGWVTIRADLIPSPDAEGEAQPPRLLLSATLGPEEVREAYRSSVMGTHYAFTLPLDAVAPAGGGATDGSVMIVASFRDAQTGRRHRAQRSVPLVD